MASPPYINVRGTLPFRSNSPSIRHRPLTNIGYAAVHYTADRLAATTSQQQETDHLTAIANFHITKDWNPPNKVRGFGFMYHYAVFQSGRIYQCNDEELITWAVTEGNPVTLSTVLVLDRGELPSNAMLATLEQHLDFLCTERPDLPGVRRSVVFGHGEMSEIHRGGPRFGNNTRCPDQALDFVRKYRRAVIPQPLPSSIFFRETGQAISNPFLPFFMANGQVPNLGLPVTGVMQETLGDGNLYFVQYCERARLEDHTHQGLGIMSGLLGVELLQLRGEALLPPTTPVDNAFASFYNTNGGMAVFGTPITTARNETLFDDASFTVQYFQRARLEDHTTKGIMRGLLGTELLAARGGPQLKPQK